MDETRKVDAERQAYARDATIGAEYSTYGGVADKEMTHSAFFREWYAERRDVYATHSDPRRR